jgi:hypothetical protein
MQTTYFSTTDLEYLHTFIEGAIEVAQDCDEQARVRGLQGMLEQSTAAVPCLTREEVQYLIESLEDSWDESEIAPTCDKLRALTDLPTLGDAVGEQWRGVLHPDVRCMPAGCNVAQKCLVVLQAADALCALLVDTDTHPVRVAAAEQCTTYLFG